MAENIQTEIVIDAPREKVWQLVSDLRRMPEWSPQTRKVLAKGAIGPGSKMLNINKIGWAVYPTRANVVDFVPNERIAFFIPENHSTWSFALFDAADGGTRLVQRRDIPATGTTKLSVALVDRFFGEDEKFTKVLTRGMNQTLERIKASAEK